MRTHERLDIAQPLTFDSLSLDPAGEVLAREGVCRNISFTGIYFETKVSEEVDRYFKVGNIVWVKFTVPDNDFVIKVQCEVRRVLNISKKEVGFGVMFINLPTKAERIIINFIR